jgi:hypothetical protein
MTLDGVTLLLLGTASLWPETGRGLAAPLLVAYWAVILHNSLVVYLEMLFGARKGGSCCASRMSLPDTFGPGPYDHDHVLPIMDYAHNVCATRPCPLGEPGGAFGVPHTGTVAPVGPGMKPKAARGLFPPRRVQRWPSPVGPRADQT